MVLRSKSGKMVGLQRECVNQVNYIDLADWYSSCRVYEVSLFTSLTGLARLARNGMKSV